MPNTQLERAIENAKETGKLMVRIFEKEYSSFPLPEPLKEKNAVKNLCFQFFFMGATAEAQRAFKERYHMASPKSIHATALIMVIVTSLNLAYFLYSVLK